MGVVTVDGRYKVVSTDSKGREKELLWALRGEGGGTKFQVDSTPVGDVRAKSDDTSRPGAEDHRHRKFLARDDHAGGRDGHHDRRGIDGRASGTAQKRLKEHVNVNREAAPGRGTYLNEADVGESDWQHAFWGTNYEKVVAVKEWDPWEVFWAPATVGNEGWAVEGRDVLKRQNGRLHRVHSRWEEAEKKLSR
ncbi:hypothetical protein B0T20DRAFT_393262 [Sordaria brevicollis]|uniref:Berberine/berberine-like domain-containing protein n=1 Tax=Sordaria brevicollis TaxID=83679 RepID=A0AAE0PFC7_SORBR|nr:hypothetical protein B0T20DRAFT_393262 [Sordaria brevicollis]